MRVRSCRWILDADGSLDTDPTSDESPSPAAAAEA
jgi:hypothetical protein